MGRVAKLKQQARATARGRRIALDHDRSARDKRIEAIAAEAILALGALDDAAGQVRAAEVRVGDALRRMIAEGVQESGAAQLCDLAVGEVRRFRRTAQTAHESAGDAGSAGPAGQAGPEPGRSPDVGLPATSDARARLHGIQAGRSQLAQPAATARGR